MKLSQLISIIGDDNIQFQNLDECSTDLNMRAGKTKITFGTAEPITLNGTAKLGLVLWLDRDAVKDAMWRGFVDSTPFVPIEGQSFHCEQDWVNRASRVLTSHPNYLDTQHPKKAGWQGPHFTAICFDQKGRRCRIGADFMRATAEDAYPIWWIWPDQIAAALGARGVA